MEPGIGRRRASDCSRRVHARVTDSSGSNRGRRASRPGSCWIGKGAPVLLVSTVRFSALASGTETVLLRSTGQYFFERAGGTWKIVSFQVVRNDTPREAEVRRRALIAVVMLLAWVAGSTFGSIAELPAASARTPAVVIGRAHGGYVPDPTGRRTITILAIGSDARPGQNPLASRADSIHVIFLHPREAAGGVVGIPRDSSCRSPASARPRSTPRCPAADRRAWCRRSSRTSARGSTTGR